MKESYSVTFTGSLFSQWKRMAPQVKVPLSSLWNKLPCCTTQKGLSMWVWTDAPPASQRCCTIHGFALGLFRNKPRSSCIRGKHSSTEIHLWPQFLFFRFLFKQFFKASNFPWVTNMIHYQSVCSHLHFHEAHWTLYLKLRIRKIR